MIRFARTRKFAAAALLGIVSVTTIGATASTASLTSAVNRWP